MNSEVFAAVDVGTGSARAGILDRAGRLLGRHVHPIRMNRNDAIFAEHDSEDIWRAVGEAVRGAVRAAGVAPEAVIGLSFDATCSLVVRGKDMAPVSVALSGEAHWDTIVWLDHRAIEEAERCNATGHKVLDFIGGVMSPEMQTPKLMWLKRHLPQSWAAAAHFFDLADFLTWKASGKLDRSQCTLVSKWTYLAHEQTGWSHDFFEKVGIPDMLEKGHLPEVATPIGQDLGPLTEQAAASLGLTARCRVGAGMIDAHAGMLGVLGASSDLPGGIDSHLGLIAGTSSCLMVLSKAPMPTRGVWGPFFGVVLPDLWINEGGQSATGALLDHIVRAHGAGGEPNSAMHARITERIAQLRREEGESFAERLHVLPDFHGNRSPLANPHALGVVSGLTLDHSFDSLCRLYFRTAVGIALGVRHVLATLNRSGYRIDTLHVTGGHTKNPLLMELYADATGCTVIEPLAEDAVLLGTAMVAATASGAFASIPDACRAMNQGHAKRLPNGAMQARYDLDFSIFLAMHRHRREIDEMEASLGLEE